MSGHRYAIGVDFGTSSVRALVVDTSSGEEIGTGVWAYPHGTDGVIIDSADPNLARQHPQDYLDGFVYATIAAIKDAASHAAFSPDNVVGIGIDSTGSTPIPVDSRGIALANDPRFAGDVDAMAWLWKDHTSHAEAAEITALIEKMRLPYLSKCGGTYSSEWYWSKMLRCERIAPKVSRAAASWVECCDYVPAHLTGNTAPISMSRGVCAAGHKAMYSVAWGGLPCSEFLELLSPGFSRFARAYAPRALTSDHRAGGLIPEYASRVGLPAGIAVAVGAFDAHMGAVGAGITEGALVKIIGTSTCDCMVAPLSRELADIPGVCGIVPESVLPGMYGIEAGQSAVGDIFNWFVKHVSESTGEAPEHVHARLSRDASRLTAGESGLLSLDWHNGNRTVLVDPLLSGLTLGQTLHTTQAEVYRSLIEATAFGALKIIDRIEEFGVRVKRVVNCGGIAEKSPLVMQIYADVCNRPMELSRSRQTCALGAAIFGAVAAGAHPSVEAAQRAMTAVRPTPYLPQPKNVAVYRELYALYTRLHDAFAKRHHSPTDLHDVMKRLIAIREHARGNR